MARLIRGNEFANRSAESRYPLVPSASAVDSSGVFTLPNDFLVGLYLSVPADLALSPDSFQVMQVIYAKARCSVVIGAKLNGTLTKLGQFDVLESLARQQLAKYGYSFCLFSASSGYEDFRGRLMIGGLDSLALQPQGVYDFDYAGAGLSVDCIRPMLRRVSAIEVVNSSGQTYRLTGTVRLRAGENANLSIETEDGKPVVVFDAVDGSQLNDELQCDIAGGTSILRVNGLPGNSQREINLIGSRCLEVQPQQMGLQLINACSEPCASCDEAEALKSMVDVFAPNVGTLTNFINRIDMMVTQLQLNLSVSDKNACGDEENPCEAEEAQTNQTQRGGNAFSWFKRSY